MATAIFIMNSACQPQAVATHASRSTRIADHQALLRGRTGANQFLNQL